MNVEDVLKKDIAELEKQKYEAYQKIAKYENIRHIAEQLVKATTQQEVANNVKKLKKALDKF